MAKVNSNKDKLLAKYRALITDSLQLFEIENAIFWSSQAIAYSNGAPDDVMKHAECLMINRHYHRAAHILKKRGLVSTHLKACYLAAKAMHLSDDSEEALNILDKHGSPMIEKLQKELFNEDSLQWELYFIPGTIFGEFRFTSQECKRKLLASIYFLKAKIHESLENRAVAADFYKAAICTNLFNIEAFRVIVQHEMLTADDEKELISSVDFECQSNDKLIESSMVFFYDMTRKKYDKPSKLVPLRDVGEEVEQSTEYKIAKAARYFYNCDFKKCYSETTNIIAETHYHGECLPIHLSCMVELDLPTDLFLLAHKLVDLYPEWSVAWFAVGCYYFSVKKYEMARGHLCKATQLDKVFGPAWLAYGHSFALENEHDQAMAAYFKASQLMEGCHLPLLYVGVEYGLTNNVKLAEKFFSQALDIAPKDPFVLHEMGVACFQNQDYPTAEKYFLSAKKSMKLTNATSSVITDKWEALFNNLGHTCRKLGRYEDSLSYHQQALLIKPLQSSTYSAIGFVQALQGNYDDSIESFHKALGIRRDDTFATTMLNNVIELVSRNSLTDEDASTELPKVSDLPFARGSRSFVAEGEVTNDEETSNRSNDSSALDIEMADV